MQRIVAPKIDTGAWVFCTLLVASLVPTSGCMSTVAVRRPVSLADAERVSHASAGQSVKVEVRARDGAAGAALIGRGGLEGSSTTDFVLDRPPAPPDRIPFTDIRSVRVHNRAKGALEGFLAGAIPGALVGLVLGSAFDGAGCSDNGSGVKNVCPTDATVVMTLGGAAIAGLVGAVIGSSVGHRTAFTFEGN